MAGAAAPILEGAITALLKALGFVGTAAGAAGAANELTKKRAESADKSKDAPIAQAGTQAKAAEKCQKCPPDQGAIFRRTFPVRKPWVDYQARIARMPNGPTFIDEWAFAGINFDGFFSAQCLLVDAKGAYDQFFDMWGQPLDWWAYNVQEAIKEISGQSLAARPRPPVRLEWFWQEPISYRYFSKILTPVAPDVPHHFEP